ncbi:hypothetical protein FQN54_003701 [Arachnomyces sp. PD_36]|nr:hypothetical protein FQN54_003701 [Arachnomyces sp. PD_36]
MPGLQRDSKARSVTCHRQQKESWFTRTLAWFRGEKEEDEDEDEDLEYVLEQTPNPKTNERDNSPPPSSSYDNVNLPGPNRNPNISGMFFRLVNDGMDPFEARELLVEIVGAREETRRQIAAAEERAARSGSRHIRFLDPIHEEEEPAEGSSFKKPASQHAGLGIDIAGLGTSEYGQGTFVEEYKENTDSKDEASQSSGSEASDNTHLTIPGQSNFRPRRMSEPNFSALAKTHSPSFIVEDEDEEEEEFEDGQSGETKQVTTPRSAYSQASRLSAEHYVSEEDSLRFIFQREKPMLG